MQDKILKLEEACKKSMSEENLSLIQSLIEEGADFRGIVFNKDDKYATNKLPILHYMAMYGHMGVLEALIKRMEPQDFDKRSANGMTALHCAAWNGQKESIDLLLPHMSEETVRAVDNSGWNALHFSATKGYTHITRYLAMNYPGMVNMRNKARSTPLDCVVFGMKTRNALTLMRANEDAVVNKRSMKGLSEIAHLDNDALQCVILFLERGFSYDANNGYQIREFKVMMQQDSSTGLVTLKCGDQLLAQFDQDSLSKICEAKNIPMRFDSEAQLSRN